MPSSKALYLLFAVLLLCVTAGLAADNVYELGLVTGTSDGRTILLRLDERVPPDETGKFQGEIIAVLIAEKDYQSIKGHLRVLYPLEIDRALLVPMTPDTELQRLLQPPMFPQTTQVFRLQVPAGQDLQVEVKNGMPHPSFRLNLIKSAGEKRVTVALKDFSRRFGLPAGDTRLIYTNARGGKGEARILAQELRRRGKTVIVTEKPYTAKVIADAVKLAELDSVEIYLAEPESHLANSHEELPRNVTLLVLPERHWAMPNPYGYSQATDSYGSLKVDRYGRDLLANYLFNMVSARLIERLDIIGLGCDNDTLSLIFEILGRAKFNGLDANASEINLRLFDLALKGPGGWGPNSYYMLAAKDRVQAWLKETPHGKRAAEYINFDFRIYFGNQHDLAKLRPMQLHRAWLDGAISTQFFTPGDQGFAEYMANSLQVHWSVLLSESAYGDALSSNDPRLKRNEDHPFGAQRPIVTAGVKRAEELTWDYLSLWALVVEAYELVRIEHAVFDNDPVVLKEARQGILSPGDIKRLSTCEPFRRRIAVAGKAVADSELQSFVPINNKLQGLFSENSANFSNVLYRFRRTLFGRGIDLGGRMRPLLETCRELLLGRSS
ncbi:MAG: hypothetical protein HY537_04995 [Deltaproteobacteria bacterium]|nr:hypothetical protein [Deltaproteobacteria bacterium]